uniref:MADF domain-containing protein n=1 Tax=Rhabditophanes sp. KR3021 TaxID=114890 RepID=A0AC35U7V9_9BILA
MECQDVKPNIHVSNASNIEDRLSERSSSCTAITDEVRFSIIEAIQCRPSIWDSSSKEARSHLTRKDNFIEVAAHLSNLGHHLTTVDVEKQWKNLKDTYSKVKKKIQSDQHGIMIPPKWRFFNAMLFLDTADSYQSQQQQMNTIIMNTTDSRKRRHTMGSPHVLKIKNETGISKEMFNPINCSDMDLQSLSHDDPNVASSSSPQSLRCQMPISATIYKTHNDNSHQSQQNSSNQSGVHQQMYYHNIAVVDDEYTAFCKSLIFSLREIGSTNRLQFLKLQKSIIIM